MQDALFAAVKQAAGSTPVAWEEVDYKPTLGTTHWLVFLVPRFPSIASMGLHGYTEHRGILQINVRVPLSQGPSAAVAEADRIRDYLRRGMSLAGDVRIIGVGRGSMMIDKAWATLPVTVQWRSHQPE
jgi:hypothetical protein